MKKKLTLSNVTLLAATSVDVDETQLAMKISMHNINFGSVKLLSSTVPKIKYPDIEYVSVPEMNLAGYNKFIIEDLYKHFETSHCLIIQADGFVINSKLWKNEFLEYDYIGAPWSEKVVFNSELTLDMKKNCVGNGGFSLRSSRLVNVTKKINLSLLNFPLMNEDVIICHYLYEQMKKEGIRFAQPEIASQFSLENINQLYNQSAHNVFGFHGKYLREYFLKEYALRASIGEW
jgi:hypothetical protein